MAYSDYALLISTDDLERKIDNLTALLLDYNACDDEMDEIIMSPHIIEICLSSDSFSALTYYERNSNNLIPEVIRNNLGLFLGSLPPTFWDHPTYKDSRFLGKTFPIFETRFRGLLIWFLTEEDVKQLKEWIRCKDVLNAYYKEHKHTLPNSNTFEFDIDLIMTKSKPLTDLENLLCLGYFIRYIEHWGRTFDEAISKKTGILIFRI